MIFEGRTPLAYNRENPREEFLPRIKSRDTHHADNLMGDNKPEGLNRTSKLAMIGGALTAIAMGSGFLIKDHASNSFAESTDSANTAGSELALNSSIYLNENKPEFQEELSAPNLQDVENAENPLFIEIPEFREITKIQEQLEREAPLYGKDRASVERSVPNKSEILKAPNIKYRHVVNKPGFKDVKPFGRETIFGNESMDWRIVETLKYKTLTSAVERRYALPPNLLMAMILQESGGAEFLANSINDGGFGLIHAQGEASIMYGLKTECHSLVCNGTNKSCKDENGHYLNHGKSIKEIIEREKSRGQLENYDFRETLSNVDERLNHLASIDLAGRIIFRALLSYTPQSRRTGIPEIDNDPLKSAICVYTGTVNFPKYWSNIKKYVVMLDNIDSLREMWNKKETGQTSMDTYLYRMQHFYAANYGVKDYMELPCYSSNQTSAVSKTFKAILAKHDESNQFFKYEKTHKEIARASEPSHEG